VRGALEVITGPMFSGKTDELLRRAGTGVLFKPWVDDRHATPEIVSHSGARRVAQVVSGSAALHDLARSASLVGIDEAQFFDSGLVEVAAALAGEGARVVVAVLDLDFRARPFPVSAALLPRAHRVDRLRAVCGRCGDEATLTQRLLDGAPAPLEDDVVRVGGAELYEPRCERCYGEERAGAVRSAS
jgi:thymidine kinase